MIKYHTTTARLYCKLTSSIPLMNPLGSFSISKFGFLFILIGKRTNDQKCTTEEIHFTSAQPHTCLCTAPSRAPRKLSSPAVFLAMTSLVYFRNSVARVTHEKSRALAGRQKRGLCRMPKKRERKKKKFAVFFPLAYQF